MLLLMQRSDQLMIGLGHGQERMTQRWSIEVKVSITSRTFVVAAR